MDVNVFGAESLARMGCNPFNKNDAIPSAKITPKKNILEDSNNQGTPTKVGKRQSHLMNGPNTTKKGKIEETIELICSDSD